MHLREDRRHITDRDVRILRQTGYPHDLEMAVTEEMLAIAVETKPHFATWVPEKRQDNNRRRPGCRRAARQNARCLQTSGRCRDSGFSVY